MFFIFYFVILYYSMGGYPCFQAWVFYPRPWNMKVLHSILAVPKGALFYVEKSYVSSGICLSHSSTLGVIAPSAPVTTDTTVSFTFKALFNAFLNPWYLSSLLCSFSTDVSIIWDDTSPQRLSLCVLASLPLSPLCQMSPVQMTLIHTYVYKENTAWCHPCRGGGWWWPNFWVGIHSQCRTLWLTMTWTCSFTSLLFTCCWMKHCTFASISPQALHSWPIYLTDMH